MKSVNLKVDHPRVIDRYIDYFGGRPAAGVSFANDPCGEGLLMSLPAEGTLRGAPKPANPCGVIEATLR